MSSFAPANTYSLIEGERERERERGLGGRKAGVQTCGICYNVVWIVNLNPAENQLNHNYGYPKKHVNIAKYGSVQSKIQGKD